MINFKNLIFAFAGVVALSGLFITMAAASGYMKFSFIDEMWDIAFIMWGFCIGGFIVAAASIFIPKKPIPFSGKIIILFLITAMSILYLSLVEAFIYGYKNAELTNRGHIIATALVIPVTLYVIQKARGVRVF